MAEKVKVGWAVDAVNTGVFATLKNIKTSLINIRTIIKLEQEVNNELQLYQESINSYIRQNGAGEGENKSIDLNDIVIRNNYLKHVAELRNQDTGIEKLSETIFSLKELEEEGVKLSANEALIFNAFGIAELEK
jgi:hypothetical protein